QHVELEGPPRAPPDDVEHVAPRPQGIPVDFQQEVSGLQTRPNGWPAGLEEPERGRAEPHQRLRQRLTRGQARVHELYDDWLRTAGEVDPEGRRSFHHAIEQ